MRRLVVLALAGLLIVAACSDDPEPDRITRIDGPASVDDTDGADNGG